MRQNRGRAAQTRASFVDFAQTYFSTGRGAPLRYSRGQIRLAEEVQALVDRRDIEGATCCAAMMARGHGKTTAILIPSIMWVQCRVGEGGGFFSKYATLITSGRLYEELARSIRQVVSGDSELLYRDSEGYPLLQGDHGILTSERHPRDTMRLWKILNFAWYVGGEYREANRRRVSVRGISGGNGDVRGLVDGPNRPDWLCVDDPMKDAEAANYAISEKVKSFVKRAYFPCGGPRARQLITGTPFNDRDLVTDAVLKNSQDWGVKNPVFLPAEDGRGRPLCPALFNADALRARRGLVGSRAYNEQYLLRPDGGGVKHFEPNWIRTHTGTAPERGHTTVRAMYLDPSLGRSAKSDEQGITILDGNTDSPQIWVRAGLLYRLRERALVAECLRLWAEYRPDQWAIEDEGAQSLLIPIFEDEVARSGLPPEAVPTLQSSGGVNKVIRIRRLSAPVENGIIWWDASGDHKSLRDQLEGWQGRLDQQEPDDAADSLEGAHRLIQSALGLRGWRGLDARATLPTDPSETPQFPTLRW